MSMKYSSTVSLQPNYINAIILLYICIVASVCVVSCVGTSHVALLCPVNVL